MIEPTPRSVTVRRDLRSRVRGWLGTSRNAPPELPQLMHATDVMDRLLALTTNGRYRLAIADTQQGRYVTKSDVLREYAQ